MALYFIGIGLNDEKDISIKGLEAIKKCKYIYLESYTSKLNCSIKKLEKLYKKKIILADRTLVETDAENTILRDAKKTSTAFLVIGDIFSATTHIDLFQRAKQLKIRTEIIHNSSIITAVGVTGLEIYKFGKITSIPFHNEKVKSAINILKANQQNGAHTLFLLDLNPKEKRYMNIKEALDYLISNNISDHTPAIGCAALGSKKPQIKYAKIKTLKKYKFTKFPQCLIIPSNLHFMEEEILQLYK